MREDHGKWLFNFRNRTMVLLNWDITILVCSSNVKDVTNIRPRCSVDETCWTG